MLEHQLVGLLKMVVDDLYLTPLINGQDLIGDITHTLTLVGHLFG